MADPESEMGSITAVILRLMRQQLEEALALARAAETCAGAGHAGRALRIALDIEPLSVEAGHLLPGLAVLHRAAGRQGGAGEM